MQALKLVHPDQQRSSSTTLVEVDLRLEGALLSVLFEVRSDRAPYVNPALPVGSSQWGLWDWDVVELFVSCSPGRLPYYEFQVSPLGQQLQLRIWEPRKKFDRDYTCAGFKCRAAAGATGSSGSSCSWQGELKIPLRELGWDGDPASITGNAFAILGPPAAREYYSLYLKPQAKPDFHLPGEFRALV